MKVKNGLLLFGVLVCGAVATALIDYVIGVRFEGVGFVAMTTHKLTYIFLGGVLLCMFIRKPE